MKVTESIINRKNILLEQLLFFWRQVMYGKYLSEDTVKAAHQQSHIDAQKNNSTLEESWASWCAALQQLLDENVKPDEKRAQDLMEHWNLMISCISGKDEEKIKAFNDLFHNVPQARADHGITEAMFEYMGKAAGSH